MHTLEEFPYQESNNLCTQISLIVVRSSGPEHLNGLIWLTAQWVGQYIKRHDHHPKGEEPFHLVCTAIYTGAQGSAKTPHISSKSML